MLALCVRQSVGVPNPALWEGSMFGSQLVQGEEVRHDGKGKRARVQRAIVQQWESATLGE